MYVCLSEMHIIMLSGGRAGDRHISLSCILVCSGRCTYSWGSYSTETVEAIGLYVNSREAPTEWLFM